MKILLSAIPFDNGKSGISVYIREVVKALENAGHELTLIVEDDGAKEFERFELIKIKKRRALFSMLYSLFILPWSCGSSHRANSVPTMPPTPHPYASVGYDHGGN